MARYEFRLPDVGEGIAQAELVAWHVQPGGAVEEDAPLLDVMTDKATVEITSPVSGRIVSLEGEAGGQLAIGSVVAVLDVATDAGEAVKVAAEAPPPTPPTPTAPPAPAVSGAPSRPLASPSVRKRARELGLDLASTKGSGPAGRVRHVDLEVKAQTPAASASLLQRREGSETVPVIGLRRRIAERMALSKSRIPHFSYMEEADLTELERLRAALNSRHPDRPRLTMLPFFARAMARALPDFPMINATFDDEAGVVTRHRPLHLGVATQTQNGLVVPVIRHAEALGLWDFAAELARLAELARSGRAGKADLSGSTITVTSLGAIGGVWTTPVINPPEVAIVGPNKLVKRPVVRDGAVTVRSMMNISSSFDHRVVDGWDAAQFVQRLRDLLETPALIFVEEPA